MNIIDFRALCAELVEIVAEHCNPDDYAVGHCAAVLARVRAALDQPPAAGPTDEQVADLAELFNGDPVPAIRRALELWGRPAVVAQPVPSNRIELAQLSLAVISAIADRVARGESLTISQDWGYGTATLITSDGSHTHVGGDHSDTRDENLALLIRGLFGQLVNGRGLSWVPQSRPTEQQP